MRFSLLRPLVDTPRQDGATGERGAKREERRMKRERHPNTVVPSYRAGEKYEKKE